MTELVFPTRVFDGTLRCSSQMEKCLSMFRSSWSPTLFIDFILNSPKFPDIRPFASPVTCSKENHSMTDCLSTNSGVSELEVSGQTDTITV